MKDFLLNSTNDGFFRNGNKFSFTNNNLDYYKQKIFIVLSFQKGEYFLDNTIGIPYIPDFDTDKTVHRSLIENAIQNAVVNIDGIKKFNSFETEFDNRNRLLNIEFSVSTKDNELIEYEG